MALAIHGYNILEASWPKEVSRLSQGYQLFKTCFWKNLMNNACNNIKPVDSLKMLTYFENCETSYSELNISK